MEKSVCFHLISMAGRGLAFHAGACYRHKSDAKREARSRAKMHPHVRFDVVQAKLRLVGSCEQGVDITV